MARALGMNPRKLLRLRPGPQQRWKPPVGEFIEECYQKRFGGARHDQHARGPTPRSRKPSTGTDLEASVRDLVRDPACGLSDLACYLVNLADDLRQWLVHGSADPEVLPEGREELREIAKALDTGAPILPIPPPPRPARRDVSRRSDRERAFDDEEIPF